LKGLAGISKKLVDAASDAEETGSKFNTVFRDIAGTASAAAQNLSDSFGLSQVAAQKLLGDTGDLLTGFGFTQSSALDLSEQVNQLAVDLASFTNFSGGAAGASAALTKALLGERESIKSLGIAITEADIKQLAEDKGIVGELDRQTKAALTLEIAVRQSGNAIGDFERTQDSFANQSRITQARLQDLQVTLGKELLPLFKDGVTTLNDFIEQFNRFLQESNSVQSVFGALTNFLQLVIQYWTTIIRIGGKIITTLFGIGDGAKFIEAAFNLVSNAVDAFSSGLGKFEGFLDGILAPIKETIRSVFNLYNGFLILTGGLQIGIVAFNVVKRQITETVEAISALFNAVKTAAGIVGDFFAFIRGDASIVDLKDSIFATKDAVLSLGSELIDLATGPIDEFRSQLDVFAEESKERAKTLEEGLLATIEKLTSRTKEAGAATDAVDFSSGLGEGTAAAEGYAEALEKAATEFAALSDFEKFLTVVKGFEELSSIALNVGASIANLQQVLLQNSIDALEEEKQARLEALGLAEETEVEKAQRQILEAKAANNEEELLAAQTALKKAQIDEEYQRQRAELDYKYNLTAWSLELSQAIIQGITAPLNAFVSTLAIPIVGPLLAPIAATAAGVTAGLQVAAVAASKPKKPSFAIGAANIPSDTDAFVHKGETIVPKTFAESIRDGELTLSGPGEAGGGEMRIVFNLDGRTIAETSANYMNNGVVTLIPERALR
jgi:hypothetical protein